jgi:hypothetical protein
MAHVSYQSGERHAVRYQRAADAGARWNRWVIYWDQVERSPGQYDWSGSDQTVAADEEFGFKSNVVLLGTPGFHNGMLSAQEVGPRVEEKSAAFAVMRGMPLRRAQAASIVPPSSLRQPVFADGTDTFAPGKPINQANVWARFVAAAATRYDGRVEKWEIWNEPDFSQFWAGSVADYARLLKVAWLAARSVDPEASVIVGGMMYWEWTNRAGVEHAWLRAFLDEMARDPSAAQHGYYFDAIPWHFYSRPSDAYDRIRSADALLLARGIGGKRQWINEANAPACGEPPLNVSCSDPNYRGSATIDEQAAYVIQQFAYAIAAGVEHASIFQLQDDGQGESFGIFRNDGTARPAYAAYQVAARYFGGVTSATREGSGDIERIVLNKPGARITALWARGPRDEVARVTAASASATLVELDGTTSSIVAVDGVYVVPLTRATNNKNFANNPNDYPIGGRPRLIVESGPAPTATPSPTATPEPRPLPTAVPGTTRLRGPTLPQRGPAA